jgi:hypothetical protein
MSGRTIEMGQSFMTNYQVWNDYLLNVQSYGQITSNGWFMPYVNIDKHSVMTSSQVTALLGYQASVASSA